MTSSACCSTSCSSISTFGKPVRGRAHRDRRDRRLRPRPAGAGLRHRSPVPASLQADRLGRERRRGHSLLLWDLRLKVGHATRSIDECITPGQGGHDDPHRAARSALPARRQEAVRRDGDALRQGGGAGTGRISSRPSSPSARSAHRRAGQSRYLVEPNVKDGKGGLARPAHAVLDRQVRLSRPRPRGAVRPRRVRAGRIAGCSAAARTSCGRCAATCTS